MAERKNLSKKTRYEILKRDSFTCQYCGKMAPEVILEVDHIIPVAEGGDNDLCNLITSCRDCNRGKGATMIEDGAILNKQKQLLKDKNEIREQIEMMIQWKQELKELTSKQIDALNDHWIELTGGEFRLNDLGKREVKNLLRRFSFSEIYDAMDIAVDTYYFKQRRTISFALNKVGGICWNKRYQKQYEEMEE